MKKTYYWLPLLLLFVFTISTSNNSNVYKSISSNLSLAWYVYAEDDEWDSEWRSEHEWRSETTPKPVYQNTVDTTNTQNTIDTTNTQNTIDTTNTQNTIDTTNTQNTVDTTNTQNTVDTTNTQNTVDTTNTQNTVDTWYKLTEQEKIFIATKFNTFLIKLNEKFTTSIVFNKLEKLINLIDNLKNRIKNYSNDKNATRKIAILDYLRWLVIDKLTSVGTLLWLLGDNWNIWKNNKNWYSVLYGYSAPNWKSYVIIKKNNLYGFKRVDWSIWNIWMKSEEQLTSYIDSKNKKNVINNTIIKRRQVSKPSIQIATAQKAAVQKAAAQKAAAQRAANTTTSAS